jgi:hypothetical protein
LQGLFGFRRTATKSLVRDTLPNFSVSRLYL